jgi:hypothetical protein
MRGPIWLQAIFPASLITLSALFANAEPAAAAVARACAPAPAEFLDSTANALGCATPTNCETACPSVVCGAKAI